MDRQSGSQDPRRCYLPDWGPAPGCVFPYASVRVLSGVGKRRHQAHLVGFTLCLRRVHLLGPTF